MQTTRKTLLALTLSGFVAGCGANVTTDAIPAKQESTPPAVAPAPAPKSPAPPAADSAATKRTAGVGTTTGVTWKVPSPGLPMRSDDPQAKDVKAVLLTFDDGPDLEVTPHILDTLKEWDCKAQFYVTGYGIGTTPNGLSKDAPARHALLKRIAAEGHQVGTHTMVHNNLRDMTEQQQREAILPVVAEVETILGFRPKFFRPPFGSYDARVTALLEKEGLENVTWSHGSLDWSSASMDPQEVVRNVLADRPATQAHTALHQGAVILMHDTHDHTAKALPAILQGLKEKGYRCGLLP